MKKKIPYEPPDQIFNQKSNFPNKLQPGNLKIDISRKFSSFGYCLTKRLINLMV